MMKKSILASALIMASTSAFATVGINANYTNEITTSSNTNNVMRYTAEVPEVCGVAMIKDQAQLGLEGVFTGDATSFKVFDNSRLQTNGNANRTSFSLSVGGIAGTQGFYSHGDANKIVGEWSDAASMQDAFQMRITGLETSDQSSFTDGDYTWNEVTNGVWLSSRNGQEITVELASFLPNAELPAGATEATVHVKMECWFQG